MALALTQSEPRSAMKYAPSHEIMRSNSNDHQRVQHLAQLRGIGAAR